MIGISVFPGLDYTMKENIKYIEKAHVRGIEYVFTSVHIPNLERERVKKEFQIILEETKKRNMKLIVDISKDFYSEFDWDKYSIYALRLDFGFNDEEIVELSKKYRIQLNASTISKEWIERLVNLGLNKEKITVCHNYYPRNNTGISLELLRKRNKFFKETGFEIMAFVPSQSYKRGPIYEGLPTLEVHRHLHPIVGAQELFYEGVDIVLLGDSMSSERELESLGAIVKDEWFIPIIVSDEVKEKYMNYLSATHKQRLDFAEDAIRSEMLTMEDKKEVNIFNTINRSKGSITLDNKHYGRYSGSLQITKKDLPADYRVNVLGNTCDNGRLVDLIKEGEKFKFYVL